MGPKLRHAFQKEGGYTFSDSQWHDYIWKGSIKTRFQYCKNSNKVLLSFRSTQGHPGGDTIAPELMGHVATPLRRKEFLYHGGCSFGVSSILKAGLIEGGKERKEGRQTIFFTPLDPLGTKQKNSTTTYRGRDKCSITLKGSLIRTPSAGSTWPGQKKRDCSFGGRGLTPLLFTIQCRPTASKKWYSSSSEDSSLRCLETKAVAATSAAARHKKNHRETCCGGKSI